MATDENGVIPPSPRYIWNNHIHQEWAKEGLVLALIAFSPTYDQYEIVQRLMRIFRAKNIQSFAIYELFGWNDLLLRIWLPDSIQPKDFFDVLDENLKAQGFDGYHCYTVHETLHHWVWAPRIAESGIPLPDDGILKDRLPMETIREINEGTLPEEEARRLIEARIIAPFIPKKGIRFLITITRPSRMPELPRARKLLMRRLKGILSEATEIHDPSLYYCEGPMQYLIMGKVSLDKFDCINDQIIEPVNQLGVREIYGIRTFTHIATGSRPRSTILQERIWIPPDDDADKYQQSTIELLKTGETASIEVKGSAFVNMNRWIFGDGIVARDDELWKTEVIKNAVAMLNADGGCIVLGALEKCRYDAEQARNKLKGCAEIGGFIVVGLENDLVLEKGNWDKLILRMQQSLDSNINPYHGGLVRIEKTEVEGKSLCMIRVGRSINRWFYIKGDGMFYGRTGRKVDGLIGPDADNYKDNNPRGDE